jgi:uncharacterized protein (DUF58 family)
MRFSLAAMGRTSGRRRQRETSAASDRGVYISVAELAGLETSARDFTFLRRQPVHSLLSGRRGSLVRGRGLAFEELRQYLPGDDVRTMDWRVTARTGKPYIRVYTEEKDRPTIIVVDQRINMFFGSVRATKSVAAAEVAALSAWRVLAQGDRIGGFVFNDTQIDELRPHRSRAAVMRLAETITGRNRELRADTSARRMSGQLNAVLDAAASIATHDHLVVVISDFDGHDARTRDLLLRLAGANEVVAVLIYDPFLLKLPQSGELVVSDGELQVELGLAHGGTRKNLADFADARAREILDWQREIGVPVMPVSAAEEVAPQVRRLLGQATMQARRR